MKKLLCGLFLLSLTVGLMACNKDNTTSKTTTTTTEEKPREVKTYIDWNFDNLEEGVDMPNAGFEGAGFKVVKTGNNGYITSKNPTEWSAAYFGTPDADGNEIFLKDFYFETSILLETGNTGTSNDGGLCLLVGNDGRYDTALGFNPEEGANSIINVWKAGNTDGGPVATNDKENFPDRGYKGDFQMKIDTALKLAVMGVSRTDEDGNTFVKLYIYVNDVLVIEQETASWLGGFGVRAWQSAMKYDYVKVTDLPLVSPDGALNFK